MGGRGLQGLQSYWGGTLGPGARAPPPGFPLVAQHFLLEGAWSLLQAFPLANGNLRLGDVKEHKSSWGGEFKFGTAFPRHRGHTRLI